MPRVTVIITTHNRPRMLPRAVASGFAAGEDVEVIVVDDASTDETSQVCQAFAGIKYVRLDRNRGVAGARNVGLIASEGEFVTFLDDDDTRLPGSLGIQIEALSGSPEAMFCYAQAIPEDERGKRHSPFPVSCPQGDIFSELLTRNFIPCGTVLFRRECLGRVGLLNESIGGLDDWDLWLRIAELFPVVSIREPVVTWRQSTRTSAQGSSDTVELIANAARHFEACLSLPRVASLSRRQRRHAWFLFSRNVAEHVAWETLCGVSQGLPQRAFAGILALLQLHPAALLQIGRRWIRPSTVSALMAKRLAGANLDDVKGNLKEIRSNFP